MMDYDLMVLGYPDMKPKPRMLRSLEEITHKDFLVMSISLLKLI
jgi:hypothetical protein